MKKSKWLVSLGIAVLSVSALAACGNGSKNNNTAKTYNYVFDSDPKTFDYITTSQSATSEQTSQMIDGLMENDKYGNLVPALAKDWNVSKDGLTYTYTLRDGINWYTADGEEYAPVTAHDFVTGLKHAIDKDADALYVVQDSIKGLKEYKEGKADFSEVGVKALDDKTVQYTLNQPETFWNSKTTYGILFPVNEKFLKTKGKDFGSLSPDSILVNGPFFLSAFTSKSSIEFTKNENYWDAKNVEIDAIKLTFYDGQDIGSLYNNFDKGTYSGAVLNPNDPTYKSAKKKYSDSITYGLQDSSTYMYFFNLNRTAFKLTKKDATQQEAAKKAILNEDFRQAITFAVDKGNWNAQSAGQDAKDKALRNQFVPPTFIHVGNEDFGQLVSKELVTYGDEWRDVDFSDAQNGVYSPEKAKAEFAKAKEELSSQGVTFPVQLDVPVDQTNVVGVQRAQSLKQSVESSLGKDNVIINVLEKDTATYENATFFAETPAQQDYDLTISGWTPDYDDASSYLDVFDSNTGGMVKNIGIEKGANRDIVEQIGLDTYDDLLAQAKAIGDDLDKRNLAFAKAQAQLTKSSVVIPMLSLGGKPRLTRTVPFSKSFAWTGNKGDKFFKYLKLQEKPVTKEQYEKAYKKWQKEKQKSNAKHEAKLANHVAK